MTLYLGIVPLSLSKAMKTLILKDLAYHESFKRSFVMNAAVNLLANLAVITLWYDHLSYEVVHVGLLQEVERIIISRCATLDEVDRLFYTTESSTKPSSRTFLNFLREIGLNILSSDQHLGKLLTRIDSKNLEILMDYMQSKGTILRSNGGDLLMVVGPSPRINAIPEILISKHEIKYSILSLQKLIENHRLRIGQMEDELKMKLKVGDTFIGFSE